MTREKVNYINSLLKEIIRLEELCSFMDAQIKKYEFNPPTRMSGFYLCFNSEYKETFREVEVKIIHDALKTRLKGLMDELDAL